MLPIVCERDDLDEGSEDEWDGIDNAGVDLSLTAHNLQGPGPEENEPAPTPVASEAWSPAMEGYEIESFPGKEAAAPINTHSESAFTIYQHQLVTNANLYAPFSSKLDWEVAKWAKLRGPSSSAFNELLQIEGVSN